MSETATVVRVETIVEVARAQAFETFVDMASWWPPSHHTGAEPWVAIVFERDVPGRWFERDAHGGENQWGRVLAFEPPARLLLDWQLNHEFAYDPSLHTDLEVVFHALDANRTRVELVHHLHGYGVHAARMTEIFGAPDAWRGVLDAYAAVGSRA